MSPWCGTDRRTWAVELWPCESIVEPPGNYGPHWHELDLMARHLPTARCVHGFCPLTAIRLGVATRPRQAIDEADDDRIGQCAIASSAASGRSTPIRRIRSGCYACAASGRAIRQVSSSTGAGRGRDAICLAPPGVATPAIPQGYRHHQETAFQFPCPVELHSARYPGPPADDQQLAAILATQRGAATSSRK